MKSQTLASFGVAIAIWCSFLVCGCDAWLLCGQTCPYAAHSKAFWRQCPSHTQLCVGQCRTIVRTDERLVSGWSRLYLVEAAKDKVRDNASTDDSTGLPFADGEIIVQSDDTGGDDALQNSCQLHVGNLDWTISVSECEDMIRNALQQLQSKGPTTKGALSQDVVPSADESLDQSHHSMKVEFKPSTNRPRDIGKYHAGSAVLTFDSPQSACRAMEHLLQQQATLGQGGFLRVHRLAPPLPPLPPIDLISPERLALRLERAASYARRRERVAASTDAVIARILEYDQSSSNGEARLLPLNPFASTSLPVLQAAELDWMATPAEIDPARGGGLVQDVEDDDDDDDDTDCDNESHSSKWNMDHRVESTRATRKRAAVEAFLVVAKEALLDWETSADNDNDDDVANHDDKQSFIVADLGCGAGNLALPLAWWLQQEYQLLQRHLYRHSLSACGVLGVDINGVALQRLRDRTNRVVPLAANGQSTHAASGHRLVETMQQDLLYLVNMDKTNKGQKRASYPNEATGWRFTDCSAVVSLHACGAASDLAIVAAVKHALPFAISPCCIGKVMASRDSSAMNGSMPPLPSSINRSAAPTGTIHYPRSQWLQKQISAEDYNLLAAAADYGGPSTKQQSSEDSEETKRWQRSRLAKQIVEMDRLQWAKEEGYYIRMMELPRIGPLYSKRELLLGAPLHSPAARRIARLDACA